MTTTTGEVISMRFRAAVASLGISSLVVAGCSASSSTDAVAHDASETAVGPTCTNVGDTLCDVALQGYVSVDATGLATSKPFASTQFSSVYAAGTQKYAFVYLSAFWCSPCKQQGALVVAGRAALADKAMFIDLLIEGDNPTTKATKTNLDAWVGALKNPFTTLIDADGASFAAKGALGIKETTYIVERASGKIVAKADHPSDGLTILASLP